MTDQSYSTLDETSLRNLLDGTVDMGERRLIRTAIRELRRREIEDMEAALTNKRFRRAPENRHEDKENQLRPDLTASIDVLSRKLQDIEDIDELSEMLQSTTEYEERKLIRAAIRRLRDEEIQGALEKIQVTGRHTEQQPRPQMSLDFEETQKEGVDRTEGIETFARQAQSKDVLRTGSDMVLVLDPLVREKVSCPLTLRAQRDSGSPSSDVIPSYRTRSDSGESSASQEASQRGRLDSGASDGAHVRSRSRSESGTSERGTAASGRAVGAGTGGGVSSLNSDVGAEAGGREESPLPEPCSTAAVGVETADGAVNSKKTSNGTSCPLKESSGTPTDSPFQQKVASRSEALYSLKKDTVFTGKNSTSQPISRTSSVRDRVRRFAEPAEISSSTRNVQKNIPGGTSYTKTSGTATAPSAHSESHDASTSRPSPCLSTTPGGGGNLGKAPPARSETPSSVQSLGAVGGLQNSSENVRSASYVPDEGQTPQGKAPSRTPDPQGDPESNMKTFLTIEIKDSRTIAPQASASSSSTTASVMPRLITGSSGQRTELTLGLRPTPFKITSSSLLKGPSIKMEAEPGFTIEPPVQTASEAPVLPNGSSVAQVKSEVHSSRTLTSEQLEAIEDEELLDRMLDDSKDFEERKMIRAAMRELRKKKRDQREKEREVRLLELRQQREERSQKTRGGPGAGEVVMKKIEKSTDGSTISEITKTNRFAQSDDGSRVSRSTIMETSYTQKSDRGTMQTKSYSYSSSSSSSSKKVGSVFDREDDTSRSGGTVAALERRQAERKKELMRAQTLPKTSTSQARKAMIEKLEKDGGNSPAAQINKVQRSTSFGVPNANSIKQMLLDWCRAKTRDYENVDIQNFSSSWSDGMAFCALVHNFFPEAFDYAALSPGNRRQNFEVAFKTAETLADCPQLLDVDDMVRMREPDWKCVYTYLQEFYRGLVQKGLVKTKNSP